MKDIYTKTWITENAGEDIPRSIKENIERMAVDAGSDMEIIVRRIALMESQVVEMGLPPAPVKDGDTRSAAWNGLGQVELDAIDPKLLQRMCQSAIDDIFDPDTYKDVKRRESNERVIFQQRLREYVNNMKTDE